MTAAPQPAFDIVSFNVDYLSATSDSIRVRDRATGIEHTIGFEGVAIGANEGGEGYTLILPRALAQQQGLADV